MTTHRVIRAITPPLVLLLAVNVGGPPRSLHAQAAAAPVALTVTRGDAEVSQRANSAGHHAVFILTNSSADTTTYDLGCAGLGRVRCAGLKHRDVTLPPGRSMQVVAFYETTAVGRGLLTLTVLSRGQRDRASARIGVRVHD